MDTAQKKIFITLFFSIFATIIGMGIVVPLLPVYARDLGASGFYVGLIFGSFSISRTLFLPFFGRLSDRKGRRPFITIGLCGYAVISILFPLWQSMEGLICLRFMQGIASAMILPVVQAYVGDITPKGSEGFVMGLFNMSLFLGLSAGPLAGGVISDRFSLNTAFYCMAGLALIGFCLSFFLLPPTATESTIQKRREPIAWKWLLSDPQLTGLAMFRLSYTSCIGILWAFLPLYADTEFSISSSGIGVLLMLEVFVTGVLNTPLGWVADRMNKPLLVVVGGLLTAYGVYSFRGANSFGDLVVSSVVFGLGGGISMPAVMAMAVQFGNRTAAMGSVMGLLTMAHSMGMLAGSLLAGLMMDYFQLRLVFSLGSATIIVGVVIFIVGSVRPVSREMLVGSHESHDAGKKTI